MDALECGRAANIAAASPPEAGDSSSRSGAQDVPGSASTKRKRGHGIVTPNACQECRRKRAKCNGAQPCSRCRTQGIKDCIYEVRVRQSKEHLREELEQLNRQKRNRDQVLAALARSDRPDLREDVLARLRDGQDVDTISEWLATVPALPHSARPGPMPLAPGRSSGSGGGSHPLANFMSPGPGTGSYGAMGAPSTSSPAPGGRTHTQRPSVAAHSQWVPHASSQSGGSSSVVAPSQSHSSGSWATGSNNVRRVGLWLEGGDGAGSTGPPRERFHGLDKVLAPEIPEMKVPASAWTTVTDDSRLVQHLLALYFCWEYPTFASLSKEHFLKDFQDGRTRYCSSILVNALLALGCRFSSHPATRASPGDPYTSGDHFFKECVRQLGEEEDHYKMTSIQALGIMSIREASCGRDSESWYYAGQSMRLALQMGLQQSEGEGEMDDDTAVRSATFWGAYSLDLAWCLATGTLPQCSARPHLPPKPAIINDIEASLWIPYTDSGTPVARSSEQPSNVRSVYKCFCELSELVHRSLYIMHTPGKPVTAQKLQRIYTDYLSWYDSVPDVLRLGHNFTPSVLFAHMYYHFAILLFFRPFIRLRIRDSTLVPRQLCLQAADAIQSLSGSYSKLYTLRRTPSFVPYFVLTSASMHLAIGAEPPAPHPGMPDPTTAQWPRLNTDLAQAISRGIADLTEMAPCHHFAEQALNILLHLAKRWNLEIRVKESDSKEAPHLKDLLSQPVGGGSRPGVRPSADSLNLFIPEVTAKDVMCAWGMMEPQPQSQTQVPQQQLPQPQIPPRDTRRPWEETPPPPPAPMPSPVFREGTENPLFWPFPMQGRPIIASGEKLREAGFEYI
ncbi:fungal-specific transcription factor domain-containing protein [Coniochaeta sp. 2T2.1]|nr:fungal-specific transcription factor domain-containing protein [Coniochaeta sp. 2T2.1]